MLGSCVEEDHHQNTSDASVEENYSYQRVRGVHRPFFKIFTNETTGNRGITLKFLDSQCFYFLLEQIK